MKVQYVLLALLMMGANAQAQQEYYDEAEGAVVEVQQQPVVESGRNPIVILNNQKYQGMQETTTSQVAQQPQTVVVDTPLSDSRAEALRKRRQGVEMHTEQRIVEKLEESRMEDEKRRADRLFGNKLDRDEDHDRDDRDYSRERHEPTPVVVVPAPAPVQAVAPAPVQESPSVRDEVRAAMSDLKLDVEKETKKDSYYISAQVGMADYPDADNVKGNMATGVSIGLITDDRFVFEGTFLYSDYEVDDYMSAYPWKEMTQYNFTGALKYQLFSGKIRPFVGGLIGYTYRSATNDYSVGGGYYGPSAYMGDQEGTSNAFDAGLLAGLDVQITDTFSIGGEYRYVTNISYERDDNYSRMYTGWNGGTQAIEEVDYSSILVNGKFTF